MEIDLLSFLLPNFGDVKVESENVPIKKLQ